MTYQSWIDSDSAPWSKVNENSESLGLAFFGAQRQEAHSGLTVGISGGSLIAGTVADGTLVCTDNTTNYIVCHRATPAFTSATGTTNWNDTTTYGRVAKAVFASGVLTWTDARFDAGGILTAAGAASTPTTTKGDLIVRSSSADSRLAVGTNGQVLVADSAQTLGVKWAAAGSPNGWFNVRDYGAVGDGSTDDSTAIAAAMTALNASSFGGVLYFPASSGAYLTAGGHVFTKPVTLKGDGCWGASNVALSTIKCTSTTAKLFDFQAEGNAVYQLSFINATTTTAGAALYFTEGTGAKLADLTINGFWISIDFEKSAAWAGTRIVSRDVRKYGIRVRNTTTPDAGDWALSDSVIATSIACDAGIYIASSGGAKLSNIKVNANAPATGFVNGVFIDVPSSVTTVIFLMSNCSIENTSGASFKARCASGSAWTGIQINNCEFGHYSTVNQPNIDIAPTTSGGMDYVVINGCYFSGNATTASSQSAISLTNINHASIGPCTHKNFAQLLLTATCDDVLNDNARYGTKTLTDGASIAVDPTNWENFTVTLGGNRTLANPTTPLYSGQVINIRILQDGTGSRTLAYGSAYKFPGGAPTLSTAASANDMISCQYDGNTSTWFCGISKAFA